MTPEANGVIAQFCLDMQAALRTLPNINPDKVFIGHKEFYLDQEFYKELQHDGFEFFIGPTSGEGDAWDMNGMFEALVEVFYTIPADKSSSLIPMMQKMAEINVAVSSMYQLWSKGGNRNARKLRWGGIHVRRHEKPEFVCNTEFTLSMPYVVDQASDPFLVPPVPGN